MDRLAAGKPRYRIVLVSDEASLSSHQHGAAADAAGAEEADSGKQRPEAGKLAAGGGGGNGNGSGGGSRHGAGKDGGGTVVPPV